ncbi:transcription elongation factor A N-terminal and central domain-containing protein 2 [Lampetra fluviatilis]
MDRFVIRTPRESPGGDGPPGSRARGGRLRQATLGSLRRVVSLVDVERLLDALAAAGVDEEEAEKGGGARRERDAEMDARPVGTEERRAMDSDSVDETREAEECRRRSEEEEEDGERRLAEALSALRHKVPSRELLVSTGLGRAVRRLRRRRGGDPAVAALAAEMYGRWRGFYEARDSLGPLRPVMVSGGPRRKSSTSSSSASSSSSSSSSTVSSSSSTPSYSGYGRGIITQLRDTARAMLTRALAEKSDEVRLREKVVRAGSMKSQEDTKPSSVKRQRKDGSHAMNTRGEVESRSVNAQGDVGPSSSKARSGIEPDSSDAGSDLSPVAVKLEQEVFCQLGGSSPSFSSSSYRRTVRAVALALSHRPQLREALASGAMTPREAVSSHRKL